MEVKHLSAALQRVNSRTKIEKVRSDCLRIVIMNHDRSEGMDTFWDREDVIKIRDGLTRFLDTGEMRDE